MSKTTQPKRKPGAQPGNTNSVGNRGGTGRPPKYDPKFAKVAEKMCRMGATDFDLAEALQVTAGTIRAWKQTHVEFFDALQIDKVVADAEVKKSLYQRALGYNIDKKVKRVTENGQEIDVVEREHVPGNVTACIFWLKNRQPDQWRDRQEQRHTHELGDTLAQVLADIDGKTRGLPGPDIRSSANGSGGQGVAPRQSILDSKQRR